MAAGALDGFLGRNVGAGIISAAAPDTPVQRFPVPKVGFWKKSTEAIFSFFSFSVRTAILAVRTFARVLGDGAVLSPAAVLGVKVEERGYGDILVRTGARSGAVAATVPVSAQAAAVAGQRGATQGERSFSGARAFAIGGNTSAVLADEGGVPAAVVVARASVESPIAPAAKDIGQTAPLSAAPTPQARHQPDIFALIPIGAPGFGGGGKPKAPPDTTPPAPPGILSPGDFSGIFSSTTISFSGTGEERATIRIAYAYNGATTTAGLVATDGAWSFSPLLFNQGTTTVEFSATDESGNRSATTSVSVRVDTTPMPPVILLPNGSAALFATSTVVFSGTASSTGVISTDFSSATTTTGSDGSWSLSLSGFPQATTTLHFFITNADSLTSSAAEIAIGVDTQAPAFASFSILECEHSLSAGACLSGSGTLHLSWNSTSTDVAYFAMTKEGATVATTTATSSTMTLPDGTYSIAVVAVDAAGNSATTTAQAVTIFSSPVVINEIAWAGTSASSADEWIELYNRTSYAIDLSFVVLMASDTVPYLRLTNTVFAGGYYLIERSSSTTTSVSEDIATAFSGLSSGSGLSNNGEVLSLLQQLGAQATTTLDRTPELADCPNSRWCAGSGSPDFLSMERKDSAVAGTVASNWASNNTVTKNGADANGGALNATPKAKNSVSP